MHLLAPGFRTTIGIFDLLETSPTPSPRPIPEPGVAKKPSGASKQSYVKAVNAKNTDRPGHWGGLLLPQTGKTCC